MQPVINNYIYDYFIRFRRTTNFDDDEDDGGDDASDDGHKEKSPVNSDEEGNAVTSWRTKEILENGNFYPSSSGTINVLFINT